MNQIFKLSNLTASCLLSINEFHVSLKDEHGISLFHQTFKEHEAVDALAKFDQLVLAMRIENTLKQKQHTTNGKD